MVGSHGNHVREYEFHAFEGARVLYEGVASVAEAQEEADEVLGLTYKSPLSSSEVEDQNEATVLVNVRGDLRERDLFLLTAVAQADFFFTTKS